MTDTKKSSQKGRPVIREMPERIPDTPENVMAALLRRKPVASSDWDYLKKPENPIRIDS